MIFSKFCILGIILSAGLKGAMLSSLLTLSIVAVTPKHHPQTISTPPHLCGSPYILYLSSHLLLPLLLSWLIKNNHACSISQLLDTLFKRMSTMHRIFENQIFFCRFRTISFLLPCGICDDLVCCRCSRLLCRRSSGRLRRAWAHGECSGDGIITMEILRV